MFSKQVAKMAKQAKVLAKKKFYQVGLVVPGILRSCSGYAGFWPWLLAAALRRQENAKTRVDRRSTRNFALCRRFGRAGACCARNPA